MRMFQFYVKINGISYPINPWNPTHLQHIHVAVDDYDTDPVKGEQIVDGLIDDLREMYHLEFSYMEVLQ